MTRPARNIDLGRRRRSCASGSPSTGYMFFRGLIDADGSAATPVARCSGALDECGWLADGSDLDAALPSDKVRREEANADPAYFEAYTAIQRLQAFHELAHAKGLVATMERIFDDAVLVHPRKIARIGLPRDEFVVGAHQDYPLNQGTHRRPYRVGSVGCVSRRTGWAARARRLAAAGLWPVEAVPERRRAARGRRRSTTTPGWLTTDFEAGDVLVFHSLTVHAAKRNHTDRLRLSADFRYQAVADPIVRGLPRAALLPRGARPRRADRGLDIANGGGRSGRPYGGRRRLTHSPAHPSRSTHVSSNSSQGFPKGLQWIDADFVKAGAATAGLLATGAWRRPVAAAPGDPLPPLAWLPTSLSPVLTHTAVPSNIETQWNHTSVLPAGALLGAAAIDKWYLFRWTHDTSHIYLYTAPKITGPFTLIPGSATRPPRIPRATSSATSPPATSCGIRLVSSSCRHHTACRITSSPATPSPCRTRSSSRPRTGSTGSGRAVTTGRGCAAADLARPMASTPATAGCCGT